jgi:hypothetical protein
MAKRTKSKKPGRPLVSATFGGVVIDRLPTDTEELELEWARRFVQALANQYGTIYKVLGNTTPPGDVLIQQEDEPVVSLEITEAVDQARVAAEQWRSRYTQLIWEAAPELKTLLSGVKVSLDDGGTILSLPNPKDGDGKTVAAALAAQLVNASSQAAALPTLTAADGQVEIALMMDCFRMRAQLEVVPAITAAQGKGCIALFRKEERKGPEVFILLRRYAAKDAAAPEWLWSGASTTVGAPLPSWVREAVRGKLNISHAKPKDIPLWLLVCTRDCAYSMDEEIEIQSDLGAANHPFERVYFFNRTHARQIFPPVDDAKTKPGPRPRGFVLGGDLIPPLSDPRFKKILP